MKKLNPLQAALLPTAFTLIKYAYLIEDILINHSASLFKGLYAIADSSILPNKSVMISAVEQALEGGASIIQYRDKQSNKTQRLDIALSLLNCCTKAQKTLIINDDVSLCLAVGAHGVHLGQNDCSLDEAQQQLNKEAIIGITCHDQTSLAILAAEQGASYVALGRFFPSTTKPNAPHCSLEVIKQVKSQVQCPLVCIGGINLQNAHPLITEGADMIAVCSSLFSAKDISAQAASFNQLFKLNQE